MMSSRTIGKALLLLSAAVVFRGKVIGQQNSADNTILSSSRNKTDNTLKSAYFSADANWAMGQEQAMFQKYLGADGANNKFVSGKPTTTTTNTTITRYTQYLKNIKVEYGVVSLAGKEGHINFLAGNYYNADNSLDATPALTEAVALKAALDYTGAQVYMWQSPNMEARIKRHYHKDTSYFPHGQLVWIEDYSNGMNADRKLHLAYKFDVYAQTPISRKEVFIDATNGKILFANSLLKHVSTPGCASLYSGPVTIETSLVGPDYALYDLTRGTGVHTFDMQNTTTSSGVEITSATNTWNTPTTDSVALDAHWGGEKVYDFWRTMGRHSWDDADGELDQYVHYDVNYDNAFWDGAEMLYGDGSGCSNNGFTPLAALDVTGHEIGHGVCQATAGLVYAGESGAMNEGFSDCWGATIEAMFNPHETDAIPKVTWAVGEELGCGNPLRRMDFPKLKGDPDTYNGTNWVNVTSCVPSGGNDQCGVHTNSGVLNKWYFLITDGAAGTNDVGNSYVVDGLGFSVSSKILYETELALASNADYNDCRNTSIGIASTTYGPCSKEVETITNAWYAVNVGVPSTPFVPCSPMIGFVNHSMSLNENASTLACPAVKTYTIGVQPTTTGPLISGGSPTVNIVYGRGNAVPGVDYSVSPSSLTWAPGSTAIKNVTLTVMDNGAVNDNKNLVLALTITPAGSNAVLSNTKDSIYIDIANDDAVPEHIEYNLVTGGSAATSNLTSAFPGANSREHTQYLIQAADLTAAGVKANSPISQIGFHVVGKNSTSPFVNYTVSMGHTALTDLSASIATTGLTMVYNGSPNTYIGWDTLDFNVTSFTWNGTNNIIVDICYGKNATTGGNDQLEAVQTSYITNNHNGVTTGTGSACPSLAVFSSGGTNTARPLMRFKQTVPPAGIETAAASTHTWDVRSGQEVYTFNTTNSKLIAGLNNPTNDLGCVITSISAAGVGFSPAVFGPINRSKKEVKMIPAINGGTTTYEATIYLTTAELAGAAPATLFMVKTDELVDGTISPANSITLTPTLFTAPGYVGFKGTFTGIGATTGSSRFFLTDAALCTPPSPVVTVGGPISFCPGDNVILSANTPGGITYQWQKNGVDLSGETNTTYTATAPGNYTVREASGACTATSSAINVSYAPPSAGTISGSTGACVGQTMTLSSTVSGGTWSTTNSSLATVGSSSGVVTGVATGTVVINYDVNNACGAATSMFTVTVNPSPTVTAVTGGMSICAAGGTTTLTDATLGGGWSSGNTTLATVDIFGTVTGAGAGIAPISYSVSNSFGCVTSAVASVTVIALPSTTISTVSGPVICPGGGSVTLNAPTGTGLTYQWEFSGGAITGATSASYTTSSTGNYNVVVTNASNCANTSATTTVVTGATVVPSVSVTASPATVICAGASAFYSPVSVNAGLAPVYDWYVNGVHKSTASAYSYTPVNGDIVKVRLKSDAACALPDTAINTVTMTVNAYQTPTVGIVSSPGNPVCDGIMTYYTAVAAYGGSAPDVHWTKNGILVATGTAYNYHPVNGDILSVTLTSNYICLATPSTASAPFIAVVEPLQTNSVAIKASKTSIGGGQTVTFSVIAPIAGASFQWYLDGVIIPGAVTATYVTSTLADGQRVSCSQTTTDPCITPGTSTSAAIKVRVNTGVGMMNGANSDFTLVPNPNKGTFTINGNIAVTNSAVDVLVTDMLGQVMYKHTTVANGDSFAESVTLPATAANGMYLVTVTSGQVHAVFHVVLDK